MKVGFDSKACSNIGIAALIFVAATASADQVVKIGHVGPLTGGIAHLGKDSEEGANLAVEEINAGGLTIGGEKITLQLDSQDDAADPRTATQVAQTLVDHNVVGVVGHLTSGTSIPASKIYRDAGVVQISPGATNPAYTQQGFKTTFRVIGTDAQQGPALAKYAAKSLKAASVAVVDDSTAYGQGIASEFEHTAQSLGMHVLSHDATNDKAIDFRAILTKIKGENPDIIMYGGMDATAGPFTKQAKQLGVRAKVMGGDGLCTEQFAALAGDAAPDVVCSAGSPPLEKMNGGNAFAVKFEKRYGQPIQIVAPFSYDAVYIIVDAMKRANSIDPKKILAQMPSTDYKGVTGETVFDSKGDLQHVTVSIFHYQSGKKTLLDVVKM
jgi:branched-chain amino acid transport system substrate-binding protein